MRATNQAGLSSPDSENIIANTLEASPSALRPLISEPRVDTDDTGRLFNSILFRFEDPLVPNGAVVAFILYQLDSNGTGQYEPVYSGLRREFLVTNLMPFSKYYFQYEVCTFSGCTRDRRVVNVTTLENPPFGQAAPEVVKQQSELNCFRVTWLGPSQANGRLVFFELLRLQVEFSGSVESLVVNETAGIDIRGGYSFIDCGLKANAEYAYRVACGNGAGRAVSEYSRRLVSSQLLPDGFEKLRVEQIGDGVVEVRWQRPRMVNGHFVSYSLLRDLVVIKNVSMFEGVDVVYSDYFR